MWPNGHPDKLRSAAGAWRLMAAELRMATIALPGARSHIEAHQSPETQQALEQHDLVKRTMGTPTTSTSRTKPATAATDGSRNR